MKARFRRFALKSAGLRWRAFVLAPSRVALIQSMATYWFSAAIHVAAKLGIADLLRDGPRTIDELARSTGTHPRSLYRLLRALSSLGIFAETADGRFRSTRLAKPLQTDASDSMSPMAVMFGEEWQWRPFGELLYSIETGQPAFDHVYGKGLFEYLTENSEAGALYDSAMAALGSQGQGLVATQYDFTGIRTIVDVGGGNGTILAAILTAHPELRGVLFDRPDVVAAAGPRLEAAGVGARCTVVGGDFFEEIPEGGDAYLLCTVIHDWDNERALEILGNCRRAMERSARLLLVEAVIPRGNEFHFSKHMDLEVLVMYGGLERTEAEYRALLRGAGFEVTQTVPMLSPMSVIEAAPV